MKTCGVIPIRLNSRRFPGKGLAKLAGKEVILHVFEGASGYDRFERLIVATDNQEIKNLIESRGGEVFFSDKAYRNGSERVADAVRNVDCDICINIQGDEVFVSAELISITLRILEDNPDLQISTAIFPINDSAELADGNLVKTVVDEQDHAVAFSRTMITTRNGTPVAENFGHVGIYAFRKDFLLKYPLLEQTASEKSESLEQLRIIEAGYPIGTARLAKPLLAINSPADLRKAEQILQKLEGGTDIGKR